MRPTGRIQLVHWNAAEAEERAERLTGLGYEVACLSRLEGAASLRQWREDPPAAVVIDLSRLPSHGREIAMTLRITKGTRWLPLVFVGGVPEKVAAIRERIPDAVYTVWSEIGPALAAAIAHPPADPVTPVSIMESYSTRPLVQKLGIKENTAVGLVDAPEGFPAALGPLPEGVQFRKQARGRCDLILWFIRAEKDLEECIDKMAARKDFASVWIIWPKKTSGVATDLTQQRVRETGLAAGLVDFKICAVDATWSGLRFARRRPKRRKGGGA